MYTKALELPVDELFGWAYHNKTSVEKILNSDFDMLLAQREFVAEYKIKRRILYAMTRYVKPLIDSVLIEKFPATKSGTKEIDVFILYYDLLKQSVENTKSTFDKLTDLIRKREILYAYKELGYPPNFTMEELCVEDEIYDYEKLDAEEEAEAISIEGEIYEWSDINLSDSIFSSENINQLNDSDIPIEVTQFYKYEEKKSNNVELTDTKAEDNPFYLPIEEFCKWIQNNPSSLVDFSLFQGKDIDLLTKTVTDHEEKLSIWDNLTNGLNLVLDMNPDIDSEKLLNKLEEDLADINENEDKYLFAKDHLLKVKILSDYKEKGFSKDCTDDESWIEEIPF